MGLINRGDVSSNRQAAGQASFRAVQVDNVWAQRSDETTQIPGLMKAASTVPSSVPDLSVRSRSLCFLVQPAVSRACNAYPCFSCDLVPNEIDYALGNAFSCRLRYVQYMHFAPSIAAQQSR